MAKADQKSAPKPRKSSGELVRSFVPATDFIGKPFGPDGPSMHFRAGVPSSPVPVAFIESLSASKA